MYISTMARNALSEGTAPVDGVQMAHVMLLAALFTRSQPRRALYSALMAVAVEYLEAHGKTYGRIVDVIGAMEAASMAYVRRTNDTSFEHCFTTARIDFYHQHAVDMEREMIAEYGDVTLLEGIPT